MGIVSPWKDNPWKDISRSIDFRARDFHFLLQDVPPDDVHTVFPQADIKPLSSCVLDIEWRYYQLVARVFYLCVCMLPYGGKHLTHRRWERGPGFCSLLCEPMILYIYACIFDECESK